MANILIAPNAFKGTYSAAEVCRVLRAALDSPANATKQNYVETLPLSDGGDGFVESIHHLIPELTIRTTRVMGPVYGMEVDARWLWDASNNIAYIESAQACGLALLRGVLNPIHATSYGLGQLVRAAMEVGAQDIYIGLGGTACTDAGLGALQALGWSFKDAAGQEVPLGNIGLMMIETIHPVRFKWPALNLMTDVENRLLGEQGAAIVFGPQKGASPQQVHDLEKGLSAFWLHGYRDLKTNFDFPGAGAAGGIPAGLSLLGNVSIGSGFELIADLGDLEEQVKWADWVVTGEGSFDRQSLMGKATGRVLDLAKRHQKRTAIISGSIEPGVAKNVNHTVPLSAHGGSLEAAARHLALLLG
jgi:glycerate 2-kinase